MLARIMSTTHDAFAVRRSRTGCGLFATQNIAKDDYVVEYTGVRIPTSIADTLKTRYLFDLEDGWTIDGSVRSNKARWMNHSCDPNCVSDLCEGRVMLFALRDIEIGEELTFDYGEEYVKDFIEPVGCKCAKCASSVR